jgi:hypothetical protein
MKRVKQYRIRLTEEEDEFLKQKSRETGLSVADIIRLGIKYQIERLEADRAIGLRRNSQFIQNWDQHFESALFQDFNGRWQSTLQRDYLKILKQHKDTVCYADGKFEVLSHSIEIDEEESAVAIEETEPETISEQQIKQDICRILADSLGGEWSGDEWIVQMFIAGLKLDLADRPIE